MTGLMGMPRRWINVLTESPSLVEHLMWQMKLSPFNEEEVRIGSQIVGNLDPNGYLCATITEIAHLEKVSEDQVEKVLKKSRNSIRPAWRPAIFRNACSFKPECWPRKIL